MKKKILCFALALLLMLSVACSSNGETQPTVPPESSTPTEPSTQATEPTKEENNPDMMLENMNNLISAGEPTATLYLGDSSAYDTFTLDEYKAESFARCVEGYTWEEMESSPEKPCDYWICVASGDGTKCITAYQYDKWGALEYTDGQSTTFWTATSENEAETSVADKMRVEYAGLESRKPIAFQIDGNAEDAAEYFATYAYGEHLKSFAPNGPLSIHEYEAVEWEAEQISEDGNVVTGHVNYAFVPDVVSKNAMWWIPNTSEQDGKYVAFRTFILQKQDDGYWHCLDFGTGDFHVTDVQQ